MKDNTDEDKKHMSLFFRKWPPPTVGPQWFRILSGVLLAMALLAFVIGCNRPEEFSSYEIVDSGAWAYDEKTYWLDNERILFVSKKTLQPQGDLQPVMSVWNPFTGQIATSHAVKNLICSEGGDIFFVAEDEATGEVKFYRGPLENPTEHPQPAADMRWDRIYECDWGPRFSRAHAPYKIKLKDENYLEILREETVDVRLRIQHGGVQYYEQLDLPPVPLPIHADLAGNYAIDFNQRLNAYFISPSQYFPEDSYYHFMWWLQRDGHLTQIPFPKNIPWPSRGGLNIFPLQNGYLALYQGGGTNSMTNTGSRGLYFINGESVNTILLGSIHGVSVSLDGCRAAFIHARHTKEYFSREKPYRTVKSINFCGGNDQ